MALAIALWAVAGTWSSSARWVHPPALAGHLRDRHRGAVRGHIPEVLCPREEGGILQRRGVIDAVLTLHSASEAGLGGGVFVVVGCKNDYSRDIITGKGLLANSR